MPQGVEGKVPDVSIFQQAVIVILEGFLLKVVTEFVGDDESLAGVLILYLLICPDIRRWAFFVGLLATSSPSGPAGA